MAQGMGYASFPTGAMVFVPAAALLSVFALLLEPRAEECTSTRLYLLPQQQGLLHEECETCHEQSLQRHVWGPKPIVDLFGVYACCCVQKRIPGPLGVGTSTFLGCDSR